MVELPTAQGSGFSRSYLINFDKQGEEIMKITLWVLAV